MYCGRNTVVELEPAETKNGDTSNLGDQQVKAKKPPEKPQKALIPYTRTRVIPLVPLDVDNDIQHLKWLSKEEFMSGMVGSPVLAESLRRMTSADTMPKESKIASLTVKVDTGMGDTEFAGFVSVGKKVLMEVWDKKKGGGNEFLGEVWINDLEECREMYEGSFPLQPASADSGGGSHKRDIFVSYTQQADNVFAPPKEKDKQ